MSNKDHCKRGHRLTPANIYIRPDGRRNCRMCRKQQDQRWQNANREHIRESRREYLRGYWLQYQYGVSSEQLEVMLKEQSNCCGICKCYLEKPCVDHDHTTGKVRGLLCDSCNQGLGRFKDNYETIVAAAEYLARTQTRYQEE